MVIRGGENIYPREIQEFLYTHPDILDAQVIGVPTRSTARSSWPGSGSRTGPRVTRRPAGVSRQLAHYTIPRFVHVVDEFPMTVTGKVRKVEMREKSLTLIKE